MKIMKTIFSIMFPYRPTREQVVKYYEDGNGFFNKMNEEEKKEFVKKDSSLPLGL